MAVALPVHGGKHLLNSLAVVLTDFLGSSCTLSSVEFESLPDGELLVGLNEVFEVSVEISGHIM